MVNIQNVLKNDADYDFSEFDYDEDPKKKKQDLLDSQDDEVSIDDEWDEESDDNDSDY